MSPLHSPHLETKCWNVNLPGHQDYLEKKTTCSLHWLQEVAELAGWLAGRDWTMQFVLHFSGRQGLWVISVDVDQSGVWWQSDERGWYWFTDRRGPHWPVVYWCWTLPASGGQWSLLVRPGPDCGAGLLYTLGSPGYHTTTPSHYTLHHAVTRTDHQPMIGRHQGEILGSGTDHNQSYSILQHLSLTRE